MSASNLKKQIDPFNIKAPKGAEQWQDLYPPYLLFSQENKEWEVNQFWFHDAMHHPRPLLPFEAIMPECIRLGLGQYNSRIFCIPNAYGIEQRILNGYVYFSPVQESDTEIIEKRLPHFQERTEYYYENWNEAYDNWKTKVQGLIARLVGIQVPSQLPEMEELSTVKEFKGISKGYGVQKDYEEIIQIIFLGWQYHFEMLNVGYVAYLKFIFFCKNYFPSIEEKTISLMIKGLESLLFKPDKILRELAQKAVSLKIDTILLENNLESLRSLSSQEEVSNWLKAFELSKNPWFHFSNGNGFYSQDYSWIDDLEVPYRKIQTYINLINQGEDLAIDIESKKDEKDKIIQNYKSLLPDSKLQEEFEGVLKRAQMVAIYLEDHNFYIENWLNTIFWNKIRDVGLLLQNHGFLEEQNDIFYLDRWQVGQALYECVATWASAGKARGLFYWKEIIKKRRHIFDALSKSPPSPACGSIPDKIQEPITLTLFGVNRDVLEKWFSPESTANDNSTLQGIGAVTGKITGKALVIKSPKDFKDIQPGDIVVCESLAPSWLSYFKQAKGIITNIGGIMSHSAIVCREYNIPCILAVPSATEIINNGEMLTIDGKEGKVYRSND